MHRHGGHKWTFSPCYTCPGRASVISCLGLTVCLHREMSSLSSEGEVQNRTMPKKHTNSLEKEALVTKTKETGALIKEEIAETGNVSRVDMAWGR
jgi:hypothetical protein